ESYTYDIANRPLTRTINGGQTTNAFTYDAAGRQLTDELTLVPGDTPVKRRVDFGYDADDHITSTVTSQTGLTSEHIEATLDHAGNVLTRTTHAGANSRVTTWVRDQRGLPVQMTDPNLAVTTYTSDAAGNQTTITAPIVTIEPGDGTG